MRKLVTSATTGKSLCHQMLMGEGKTTVVAPLLALLLADGSQLVMQIVPAPLLRFSLGVLRGVFSGAPLRKAVWTFRFNRRAHVTETLLAKANTAVRERAVMVSTPGAIKAFMLKQLELLHLLDSGQYPQDLKPVMRSLKRMLGFRRASARANNFALEKPALHEQARRAVQLLQIWRGAVAVIDEVDVVLHPLRSELNWPLGDRHALDFSPFRWQLPWHLLHAIMAVQDEDNGAASAYGGTGAPAEVKVLERLRAAVEQGAAESMLQRVPHVALLSDAFYHASLRPILAEWAVQWMRRNGMHEITDEQALRCLAHGVSDPSVQAALSDAKVKMLNLASDWLLYFLPHVLKKVSPALC